MDWFSLVLNVFSLAAQGILHILFAARLTGKKAKAWHFALYLSLLFLLDWVATALRPSWVAAIGAETLVLYGMSRRLLRNRPLAAGVSALLANNISQLSFGLINSIEAQIFPCVEGKSALYVLIVVATPLSFAVCAACYALVLTFLSPEELGQGGMEYLFVPMLFFFASELYIMQTTYTQEIYDGPSGEFLLREAGKHTALLFLQALELGSLLCTLYAYRQLCRAFQAQAAFRSLTQTAQAQKIYINEAQTRCEQTKAFRHDIANHLTVLDGLLSSGKVEEGRAYLQKLKAVSASLSFPCQTGNPVVDVLLREKLALAEEIETEISLILPHPCGIEDFDLCVIFANALDNALHACRAAEGSRCIRIHGERQGDFYMLAFENTCPEGPLSPEGTGLSNIRAAAEKYRGAVLTEKIGRRFSLNVLLNISLQSESISVQKP